ncbi:MAG: Holliday junction resolvase RuvX [Elusimicrobia bacterium]|jgi:putative Holliday junction resolvase|nr:Holliday junction resolvase RuvX [Elusimicrobiota bacterium]MBK7207318.1 Holliday junction resolvase RuvX [Elusimicrobiota bacterium]MBK7546131.1 Holliday junction resolvase RuvX [Elusimicrobiota bacterium]MBK7575479.1 Holliday junction resolvase RuvX [Elusimicrobiota bacterium]MBK7689189.1 Holliday junction resolvase RuvX [Elusimicrobiota bacterium]
MVRVNICLGVDWGRRRVGVAVSDELGLLAHPLATIEARSLGDVVTRLTDLARERGADTVVLGIPRHMNGAEGDSATAAALLGRRLAEGGLRVEYVDERLTTVEAEARLRDGGRSARARRDRLDQAAAAVILQTYLDARRGKS